MNREKLARAQSSKSLQQRSFDDGRDVDVLLASGLAQTTRKRSNDALMARAYSDASSAAALVKPLANVVRIMCQRERWRIRGQRDGERLASAALLLWREPNCPSCGGRKFERLGQMLSDMPCQTCEGTGQRPMPTAADVGLERPVDNATLTKYIKHLLSRLEHGGQAHLERVKARMR